MIFARLFWPRNVPYPWWDEQNPSPPPPPIVDEDYPLEYLFRPTNRGNPVAPALPRWQDDIQDPGGSLFGQPDEDFPPEYLFRPKDRGEPVWPSTPQWRFDEQEPAGALRGQPDEDFDWNRLWGLPWPSWGNLWPSLEQWKSDTQEPAGSLLGQLDEDFDWRRLSGPPWPEVGTPVSVSLPQWQWDEQFPAGSLFGVPEESAWMAPRCPSPPAITASIVDEEIVPQPAPTLGVDEDLWFPQLPQALPASVALLQWVPEQQEIVSAPPIDDDAFLPTALRPVAWIPFLPSAPWLADEVVIPLQQLSTDEDFFIPPVLITVIIVPNPMKWEDLHAPIEIAFVGPVRAEMPGRDRDGLPRREQGGVTGRGIERMNRIL